MTKQSMMALLLVAAMLLSLVGCGVGPESTAEPNTTVSTTTSATTNISTSVSSTTTSTTAGTSTSSTTTSATENTSASFATTASTEVDMPLSLTVEQYQGKGPIYTDISTSEANYTLKLTAHTDFKQLRLISLDPETSKPDKALHTFTPLKKGESQYIRTYINDANPNRGILCTDSQGNTYFLAFIYSGKNGAIHLQEIRMKK